MVERRPRRHILRHIRNVHLQLEVAIGQHLHQDRVVKVARRLAIDGHNRQGAKIAPPLHLVGRDRRRCILRCFERRGREVMGQVKLADRDLDIDAEIILAPQNLNHPSARILRGRRPIGNLDVNHHALKIVPLHRRRSLGPEHAIDRRGLPLSPPCLLWFPPFHPGGHRGVRNFHPRRNHDLLGNLRVHGPDVITAAAAMKRPHHRRMRPPHRPHDPPLRAPIRAHIADVDQHRIPMHGMAGQMGRDKNIASQPRLERWRKRLGVRNNKSEPIAVPSESARHQILSRQQSYHGSTLGALSVSGNKRRREIYLPMVRECAHVGMPYCYRCDFDCTDGCRNCGRQYAAELERAIEDARGEAAAFIFEPVSGATLGAVVPPPGYLPSVAEICRRHGVLLIADEVMTGMGRTGRNFAVEHWLAEQGKIGPDILVTAKGLSSGYAPLGAVIASHQVVDAIADGSGAFLHGFTYHAHPVALAAGRAVLHYLKERNLVAAADSGCSRSPAAQFQPAFESLRPEEAVGDVRGIGLLWAIEFVADKASKRPFAPEKNFSARVGASALKRGLLVYPMQGCVDGMAGDHILLAPPAIIKGEQIAQAAELLRGAVREAFASL